ncbi:hypothetical protein FNV43_RR23155 [Rhamnella rubrinervis]|uniref:Uncharacterized protein n=1 Tax=Rhamnella rubrinervis TaxID=2594499 RepID=A0A8K0GT45_9ROSA|nr:hypothetical protein FNV43_RR23155 [Rhamnella rubrinervis]
MSKACRSRVFLEIDGLENVMRAINFYQTVFEAEVVMIKEDASVQLRFLMPMVTVILFCSDIEVILAKARRADAPVVRRTQDGVNNPMGQVLDPVGILWHLSTRAKTVGSIFSLLRSSEYAVILLMVVSSIYVRKFYGEKLQPKVDSVLTDYVGVPKAKQMAHSWIGDKLSDIKMSLKLALDSELGLDGNGTSF